MNAVDPRYLDERYLRGVRIPIREFRIEPFAISVAALILAPVLALNDLAGSYVPFLALRLWMVGFSIYALILAKRASGLRQTWAWVYGLVGLTFLLIWGLDAETWAAIDLLCAVAVATSAPFLRSEPLGALANSPEWRALFEQELLAHETPDTMNWKLDRFVKHCARAAVRKRLG